MGSLQPMRIAIVGSGALGGFYGGMLARRGFEVHFLMRRFYDSVRRDGLKVKSILGDFHLEKVNCYDDVEDIPEVDLVFVGMKTTANHYYQELLGPLMGSHTVALTAQNGLGNEERLAELFGQERVAGGLAFLCSNRLEDGTIDHLDYGHMHIGNFDRKPDPFLERFCEMLRQSGIACEVVESLALSRWKKLMWNVAFNGLTTLLYKQVNEVLADEFLRGQAFELMKEIQQAAGGYQLMIEDAFLDQMMEYSRKMKPYSTSMQLDAQAGRPLEIESIFGEPLRRGQAKGAAMPLLQELYKGLKQKFRSD